LQFQGASDGYGGACSGTGGCQSGRGCGVADSQACGGGFTGQCGAGGDGGGATTPYPCGMGGGNGGTQPPAPTQVTCAGATCATNCNCGYTWYGSCTCPPATAEYTGCYC
jgi:hypothetical protein